MKGQFEVERKCKHCGSTYKTHSDWDVRMIYDSRIESPLLPYYQEMVDLYLKGYSLRDIAIKYDCQYRTAREIMLRQGISLRKRGSWKTNLAIKQSNGELDLNLLHNITNPIGTHTKHNRGNK